MEELASADPQQLRPPESASDGRKRFSALMRLSDDAISMMLPDEASAEPANYGTDI